MPTIKDAIIIIKNAWKQVNYIFYIIYSVYVYTCISVFIYQVTKETIVNCWKKSGLIDFKESVEQLEINLKEERIKYTKELDDELIEIMYYFG